LERKFDRGAVLLLGGTNPWNEKQILAPRDALTEMPKRSVSNLSSARGGLAGWKKEEEEGGKAVAREIPFIFNEKEGF